MRSAKVGEEDAAACKVTLEQQLRAAEDEKLWVQAEGQAARQEARNWQLEVDKMSLELQDLQNFQGNKFASHSSHEVNLHTLVSCPQAVELQYA